MHIVHVIRDLDSASGGPSRSLPALLRGLARVEPELKVSAVYQNRGNEMTVDPADTTSIQYLPVAGGSTSGPFRVRKTLDQVHRNDPIDLIHLHGLWSPSIHLAAGFARRRRVPYVLSPRGMLSTWCLNNKSMRKRVAWWSYQQRDLQLANCLHATSNAEAEDIRSVGLKTPISMIPHGCDLPPGSDLPHRGFSKSQSEARLAVCITRIHPVKGLGDLLQAWASLRPTGWQLVIAGPDATGYGDQLRDQINQQQLNDSVRLIAEVDSAQKWDLLSRAELFISASHSENFGMSIAEAMAAGVPVVTTQGTPWETVIADNCGWWVKVGAAGLTSAIKEAISLESSDLAKMGQRGSELIRSEYSWDAIAGRTLAVYRWLLDQSIATPVDVRLGSANTGQPSQLKNRPAEVGPTKEFS